MYNPKDGWLGGYIIEDGGTYCTCLNCVSSIFALTSYNSKDGWFGCYLNVWYFEVLSMVTLQVQDLLRLVDTGDLSYVIKISNKLYIFRNTF